MSNLSDLLPAGAGAKVATLTADGTLPSGQAVALQSDGTVKVISSSSESESLGSAVQIDGTTNLYGPMAAFDSTNNKVVVVYRADSGGYATAVAGTVSGSSITFGTALTLHSVSASTFAIEYNVNQDAFLVTYKNSSSSQYGFAVGVTITSGTTLSAGTPTTLNSSTHRFGEIAYNSTTYDMFCVYSDSSADLDYRVVTMTGTSLSIGSANAINGSNNHYNGAAVAYCPHQERMLVVFCDGSDNDDGEYRMYSASGSTYTSVASGTYESSTNAINPDIVHIGNSQFVIGHRNDDSYPNWDGEFYVATITSSTVTIGTKLQYENMQTLGLAYDSNADKVVVLFDKVNDSSKGYYGVGTVSGTGASATISFDTAVLVTNGNIEANYVRQGPTFDSNSNKVILPYRNRTDNEGIVHVLTTASTSTNSGDYIGITNQAISDSASGEVAVQGGTITNSSLVPATISAGTPVNYEAANIASGYAMAYDSANYKVLIVYNDGGNSQYGTAIVGTVSGTSISFGSPSVFNSAATTEMDVAFDVNAGKFVIVYKDANSSFQGRANVATISGTSVSFGSQATLENAVITAPSGVYDANAQKTVFAYYNGSASVAAVGTISGTDVSFGTSVQFSASTSTYQAIAYDSTAQKVVIAFTDSTNSNYPSAIVGTVSGTSISFGSATAYDTVTGAPIAITYDSGNNKHIVVYREVGSSPYGMKGAVGTVSGTSISFGTAVENSGATNVGNMAIAYHTASGSAVVHYRSEDTGTKPMAGLVTVSGTSLSFGTPIELEDVSGGVIQSGHASVYDSQNQKIVAIYTDNTAGVYGDAAVIDVATGLTVGSTYYVQDDGTLSTTSSSVTAGKALSGTTLLLNG